MTQNHPEIILCIMKMHLCIQVAGRRRGKNIADRAQSQDAQNLVIQVVCAIGGNAETLRRSSLPKFMQLIRSRLENKTQFS
jgi:predicted nucleic acid-binding Zn ribbon protein